MANPSRKPLTYAAAGVSIDAGDELVRRIAPLARRTSIPGVLGGIGGFGGLFEIPAGYRQPVLVSGTDGVGTKLKLAFSLDGHDTVGQDLVAMSVNDVLVQGARPLFFLDYFACGHLEVEIAARVVGGIARACEIAGCSLLGGETAEMPGMYPPGEYDLAGFAVGIVEKDEILDGSAIAPGDAVLGLASSGPHSNGYSLIRRIIEASGAGWDTVVEGATLRSALLEPTRIYCRPVLEAMKSVRVLGLAHITGGGLVENVPRVLPEGTRAVLHRSGWKRPPVFDWLQQAGAVEDAEMHRVFNCGVGMVVVVARADADAACAAFARAAEPCSVIGAIEADPGNSPTCIVR
jgi:phosphoribosylformylglycinamidine cyclo-ligase